MRLCAGLLTAVFLAFPAWAQEEPIQNTIQNQLNALQADDFSTAFSFASPTIKSLFGTPDNFGLMVRQGYPMVYRPGRVQMLDLREVAGALWQRVMITDEQGRTHLLDYQMIETGDGWQINGVQLLPSAGVGA
ncbi:DUF4864 domain-containing protein [Pseudorhodobacter sp. MZDSW-24AT]|uniref:DUF4864 domain-containing protein n=1 Tax=Pseudorhodobacter sp. MZDSW-24AT TaxID=2052957 RepID=UPI000C1E8340|nr:DUF4864 domain-containing protein [Pseudorhodobacter sp. MZDSW-24AT]PJF07809.1 DUF4864 domain-containing protein [Pseudorhodobacter sp. MZDSW-24AT]